MDPSSEALAAIYRLSGAAFDKQFNIRATNVRHLLLQAVVTGPFSDGEEAVATAARSLVLAQKDLSKRAGLTDAQADDFQARMDSNLADAVVVIRGCLEVHPDRMSPEFQLMAATELGIPLAG